MGKKVTNEQIYYFLICSSVLIFVFFKIMYGKSGMYKIKRLLFFLGLMIVGEMQSYKEYYYVVRKSSDFEEKVDRFLTYAVGGMAVLYVGAYLYGRESNANVVRSVDELYKSIDLLYQSDVVTLDSLILNSNFFCDYYDIVFILKKCLQNRYGSWVKPWDWSFDMQQAYAKIRLIALLYGYIPLLEKAKSLKGEDVLQFAREQFSCRSQYPCVFCFESLDSDIAYGYANITTFDARLIPVLKEILPMLQKAKKLLQAEKEYLDEARVKIGHGLQEAQLLATICRR